MSEGVQVPKLLRISEVSTLTRIPRWRLYELIKSGKGPPCFRTERTLWIPEHSLVAWIEEQSKSPKRGE